MILTPTQKQASVRHALDEHPNEAVGVIVKGKYVRCENVSPSPEMEFSIAPEKIKSVGKIEAVIHSHTKGQDSPSQLDMIQQISMNVPWFINVLSEEGAYKETFSFGDHLLEEPLIGRHWKSGALDCISLSRAYYWQEYGLYLPDLPRYDGWWEDEDTVQLFARNRDKYGMFQEVNGPAAPGDLLLMAIRANQPNHFAVLVENNVILHQTVNGLSARRPFTTLQATLVKVLRHQEVQHV